jgi:hypothetical protein
MAEPYPHEDAHIGRLLAGHREAMGISQTQLGRELGHRGTYRAQHIENQALPAYEEVEEHHQGLIEAFMVAGSPKGYSLARREQWWATATDLAMWQAASEINPPVVWWWGTRGTTGERGAYCNLCQALIHGYDSGRGMTRRARLGVMAHRLRHIHALTDTGTPIIKEIRL